MRKGQVANNNTNTDKDRELGAIRIEINRLNVTIEEYKRQISIYEGP